MKTNSKRHHYSYWPKCYFKFYQLKHVPLPSLGTLDSLFKNSEQQWPTEPDGKTWHLRSRCQSKDDDDELGHFSNAHITT